ncbi:hypothetical protein [Actinomadura sp. HBU206391]|uniref:hypothetical protein n=1 Tax=Actinomadura sp. HBU206391 TaxID=2731692 RepID=UPI0016507619|nr:hypothetical protein [Actinomadura sp. HBU206391]MBC6459522.1 hypothetical protein [Actinomadura sp. HBU206391]
MGFSHTLVAVRDLSPDEAAARLGRSPSGETTDLETATTGETPGWCVSAPIDGWTFLVDKGTGLLTDEDGLARLSAGTRLLTFFVEEHVMAFGTTCWTDGAYAWEVLAQDGDLYVIGDPPPFGELVSGFREGPGVVAALDEVTAPPPEMWEELGFDGNARPSARAAALGLAVRRAEPAEETSYHQPAVEIFARLTGHVYDRAGALHDVELQVLGPALVTPEETVR